MGPSPRKGKVQTVTGLVSPSELGQTLVHEHLSMSFDVAYVPPSSENAGKSSMPFSMENLGWIRYNPYSHQSNLKLNDKECETAIASELAMYRAAGGGTIVECTTHGIERKANFLRELSESTGVKVITGTGYYVAASHRHEMYEEPIEHLITLMHDEIVDGCKEAPQVRCGIIGELGCSWPLHGFERKVISAAAQVQEKVKCPVSIHPGRNPESPGQVLRIFQESGGNAGKLSLCHLDRTLHTNLEELFEFAKMGSYLEFDLFGIECSHYQLNEKIDMLSDAQRVDTILQLINEGYEDKIIISHDIHTKHRLTKFGGHGYSHILENIVPKMISRGISAETVHKILVTNPSEWLTFQ